jgi:hypothetical protein
MNDDVRNETTEEETGQQETTPAEEAVGALFAVGRLWASHGLNAARLALETSAKTLEATADALGDASDRIGHDEAS